MKSQGAAGAFFNQLADLIAVPRSGLDQREDQQLALPFFSSRSKIA